MLRKDCTQSTDSERFAHSGDVAVGAEAAEAVLRVFEHHGQPSGLRYSPWHDFVDLSCQLNAYPWDATDRFLALLALPDRLGRTKQRRGPLGKFRALEQPKVDHHLVNALLKWRARRHGQPWQAPLEGVLATLYPPLFTKL